MDADCQHGSNTHVGNSVLIAALRLQFNGPKIRRAKCEIYHYNSDGTLDWGYFQINTVHLERPGLNLRELLDCKTNIDFAYQLYQEKHGFTPWSTYNSGKYRQFLQSQ